MENLTTQLRELFAAIERDDIPQVRRFMAANVSPRQQDGRGYNALMLATPLGNPQILRMLHTAAILEPRPAPIVLSLEAITPHGSQSPVSQPPVSQPPVRSILTRDATQLLAHHTLTPSLEEPVAPPSSAVIRQLPSLSQPLPDYEALVTLMCASSHQQSALINESKDKAGSQSSQELKRLQTAQSHQTTSSPTHPNKPATARPWTFASILNSAKASLNNVFKGAKASLASIVRSPNMPWGELPTPTFSPSFTPAYGLPGSSRTGIRPKNHRPSKTWNLKDIGSQTTRPQPIPAPTIAGTSTAATPGIQHKATETTPINRPAKAREAVAELEAAELETAKLETIVNRAQPQTQSTKPNRSPIGSTPEATAALNKAVYLNDFAAVKTLLQTDVDLRPATWYETPILVVAAGKGHLQIVQALVEAGANVNGGYSQLPLHVAAERGYLTIVDYLLEAGADLEAPESNGRTPLMAAATEGHVEIIQRLVERGANLWITVQGETPLSLAEQGNHSAAYQFLKACDDGNRQPPAPISPLDAELKEALQAIPDSAMSHPAIPDSAIPDSAISHPAISHPANSQQRVSAPEEFTPEKSTQGSYPLPSKNLLLAAKTGNLPQLMAALNAGAGINDTPPTEHRTALSTALETGHIAIVERLLEMGADPNQPDGKFEKGLIAYPLMVAATSPIALHRSQAIHQLIAYGACLDQTDGQGRTALMHAVSYGHCDAIATLIEANADLNMRDHEGQTALMQAKSIGNPQVIQRLQVALNHQKDS